MNAATREIAAVGAHLNEVYPMLPFTPVRGAGVYLENTAGRRILDFYGGHAVAALGYGHRDLSDTLARQSRELVFQTNALPLKIRDEAAEKHAAFGPPGLGRVFFVNSGAEANENALRLAFKVTGRTKIVAMEHSFHGRTAAAAAVTYGAAKTWYGFPRAPFDVVFVPRNDAAALAAAVDSSTAAVIIEPVQGLAGAFDFAPEFMNAVRVACDRSGALMIIDEVQTGMGRLGTPFGAQLYGVRPDLLTVAKGLGGGFPCGAVLLPHTIAADLKAGALGTTFGGGPVACAAIKTVIEVIERDNLLANVRDVSAGIRATCRVGPSRAFKAAAFSSG
jgi:acetylornithine/succinyldiaminopimelate/putrescine aminotransferase